MRKLGRIAAKSSTKALMFAHFLKTEEAPPTSTTKFWNRRAPFPTETWGNDAVGDCTIASQCNALRRFERLERKSTIAITTEEAERVYYKMTDDLYGGGDTGAYIEDALSRSRSEQTCLHDTSGHPLTIDAFTRVDPKDQTALKWAVALAAGKGVEIGISLPLAYDATAGVGDWSTPDDGRLVNDWKPESWGGHAIWAIAYDAKGLWLEHTWNLPPQRITWAGVAAYIDEAFNVIDSVDAWRMKPQIDVAGIVAAVNKVSRTKIAA